jgi:Phycobilisome protein
MMNPEFQALINDAEDHYLQSSDVLKIRQHLATLPDRIAAYEVLRDREEEVFQAVADELQTSFASLPTALFNRVLENGLALLRYGAMAMVLDNPTYLQQRLLESMPDQLAAYELAPVATQMLQLLQSHLSRRIEAPQVALIKPYIEQAQNAINKRSERSLALV